MIKELAALCRDIKDCHPSLQKFAVGGTDTLVNNSRHDGDYPLLFLEIPTIEVDDRSDAETTTDDTAILILIEGRERTDYDIFIEAEDLAINVIQRLLKSQLQISNIYASPIGPWTDDTFGYRITFSCKTDLSIRNCP